MVVSCNHCCNATTKNVLFHRANQSPIPNIMKKVKLEYCTMEENYVYTSRKPRDLSE